MNRSWGEVLDVPWGSQKFNARNLEKLGILKLDLKDMACRFLPKIELFTKNEFMKIIYTVPNGSNMFHPVS